MQCFDWDSNILNITTSNGIKFSLKLRGNKTIITGSGATGKTLLYNTIKEYKENSDKQASNKISFDNIFLLDKHNKEALEIITDKLIIIDRADLILKHKDVNLINRDNCTNKYLIMSRSPLGIELSPNYFAEMVKHGAEVTLQYMFSIRGWF